MLIAAVEERYKDAGNNTITYYGFIPIHPVIKIMFPENLS